MNDFTNFAVMSYSFHGLRNIGAMDIFGYLETVRYRYNLQTADRLLHRDAGFHRGGVYPKGEKRH